MSTTVHLHVLIVDDEPLIRWAAAETLKAAGHTVTESSTGAAALRALAQGSDPVDVVLLDFRLPDCSDLELLAAIRRASPSSAVVMMTAYGTLESITGAMALGAYDVIAKPFDMTQLEPVLVNAWKTSGAGPHPVPTVH